MDKNGSSITEITVINNLIKEELDHQSLGSIASHAEKIMKRAMEGLFTMVIDHGMQRVGLPSYTQSHITQARSTSATDQAWAIQPRGRWGASPSKISLMLPTPAVLR
jgi:hypothetical protein